MRYCAAILSLAFLCTFTRLSHAQIVVWDPRIQVSDDTEAGTIETTVRGLALQRDGQGGLHALLGVDKTGFYTQMDYYNGNAYYLSVDEDLDWADGWSNRVRVTFDDAGPTDNTWISADQSMTIDSDNEVHVLCEDFRSQLYTSSPSNGITGYKTTSAPRWDGAEPAWTVSYRGGSYCAEGSPTFFLWDDGSPGTAGDTLHVVNARGGTFCADHVSWKIHRKRALADPDSAWSADAYVTNYYIPWGSWTHGEGTLVFVGQDGDLHLIGRKTDENDIRTVTHVWGAQAGPGDTMTVQVDTLDVMDLSESGIIDEDSNPSATLTSTLFRSVDEFIDVAWNHIDEEDNVEVWFSRIPLDDPANNSSPIRISPDEGGRYGRARISHDSAGNVYAAYIRGQDQVAGARQFASFSSGDPTNQGDWLRGLLASPEVRTWATDGFLAARNDSLFSLYQSGDDDADEDEDYEAWFQLGHVQADSVGAGQKVVWTSGSQVALAADFVVASAGTLFVEPGVTVWAASNVDNNNRGRYASKVEIINRGGIIQVEGQSEDRVKFRSTSGGAGEWGGLWFDVAAASSGYGFTSYSRIENADIEDATEGIGIMNSGAPSLVGLTFDDITDDRHILIDSTDIYVPWGHWDTVPNPDVFVPGLWDLAGPMNVIVTRGTRLGRDIIVESDTLDVGKVNIVAQGKLNTSGSSGNRVVFRPDVIPPEATSGNEWAGVIFDWISAGSVMEFADIGYARVPLTLYYQNAIVESSRIHHFRDRGIWAYGMGSTVGPRLIGNTVFRDTTGTADLDEEVGLEGIVLEQLASGLLDANTISLAGMLNPTGGSGISFVGTSTYCGSNPASPETLRVMGCTVTGPGASADAEDGLWSGLRGTWFCGSNNKKIIVQGNQFTGWNEAAFNFVQSSDIQVSCNNDDTSSNRGGVIFSRTSTATGADVRFLGNVLRIGEVGTNDNQQVIRTDDAVNLALGQSAVSTKGKNQFLVAGQDWYVEENDSDAADSLQAQSNYWKRNGVTHTVVDSVQVYVTRDTGITGDAARVKAGGLLSLPPTSVCGIEAKAAPGMGLAVAGEGEEGVELQPGVALVSPVLPQATALTGVRPSPVRGSTTIAFDIAASGVPAVQLDVFDVRGRRVSTLVQGPVPPGRYSVGWDRSDAFGHRVAPGVYFVRFAAGTVEQVRKVVVIR